MTRGGQGAAGRGQWCACAMPVTNKAMSACQNGTPGYQLAQEEVLCDAGDVAHLSTVATGSGVNGFVGLDELGTNYGAREKTGGGSRRSRSS